MPVSPDHQAVAAVLKDHSGAVYQYFGSIRIPAAFISGASYGALFVFKDDAATKKKPCRAARLYPVLVITSFVFALSTVVLATAAITKNLHGDFDPMASSGYMLLQREFEFPFVATRLYFYFALLSFIGAVTTRILIEFDLLATNKKYGYYSVLCAMLALTLHILSFINETLFCWNNLFEMSLYYIRLLVNRCTRDRPLMMMSLVLCVASLSIAAAGIIRGDLPTR